MNSPTPLFENEHALIVDKRAGWLTIPGRPGADGARDPRSCEIDDWSSRLGIRLWVVHRLDAEVTGVLVFAKTAEAHRQMNAWFENHQIEKTYEALTEIGEGKIPDGEQSWKSHLLRGKRRAYEKPFGKLSETLVQWENEVSYGENPKLKLNRWRVKPLTGRSHQIRFEMAKHGHSIWGDKLYAGQLTFPKENAIGLRAVRIDFSKCQGRSALGIRSEVSDVSLLEWLAREAREAGLSPKSVG